jgi:hypothetical protein
MPRNTAGPRRASRRRLRIVVLTAITTASTALTGIALTGPASALPFNDGGATSAAPSTSVSSPTKVLQTEPGIPSGGIFGPASIWKKSVATAPIAKNSAAEVAGLAQEAASEYGGVAAFNVWQYNTSVYTVAANTPLVNVSWNNCQGKSYTPTGLLGPNGQFTAVPIPANAVPATGSDAELTVYSPSTDQLWEFWKAARTAKGWSACWGGRIDHVSTSPGYFQNGFGA